MPYDSKEGHMVADNGQTQVETVDVDDWEIPSFNQSNGKGEREVPQIDPGLYVLEVTNIGKPYLIENPQFNPNGNKRQFELEWTVVADSDGDTTQAGFTLKSWYTVSMHEKSNLYKASKAIFGGELDPDVPIKPSMLLGKRVMGYVDVPDLSDEDIRNGKLPWPKVTNLLPMPKSRRGAKKNDEVPF